MSAGSVKNLETRLQLDRLEAMLQAVVEHLGVTYDADEALRRRVSPEVIGAIKAGSSLKAIKIHRDQTGAGLAEAKYLIDRVKNIGR